ncbi:MAG: DUF2090 domain-containing protein [Candidatus Diapherotrites archaeon]|uniref:DUF2090 domain-containing protein n=1 Tax=Candidatus Iainarchaeum sp. TaxID=3101447 RepID=A0A8T3YKP4_9ARCH|nr:DUF2090 domain-containing protein [Candidatus Diapherotrites archaeon]
MEIGYENDLLVLPFDHRGSLLKKLFGIEGRKPTEAEAREYASLKEMVYDGFLESVKLGVPKDGAAVLVDEEFGAKILKDAKAKGFITAMPTEKSGQDEFDFEHSDYKEHIKKIDPAIVKVLVRYNPEGDSALNERQLGRLKSISDFAHETGKKFMFELLVPATSRQLEVVGGDKGRYDRNMRPMLMVRAMEEIQKAGVEPDIWKLEGVDRIEDSKALVRQAHEGGRRAGIITLGRGEDPEKVKEWLKVGAKVNGIIGFAVGRTVFWEPMKALHEKRLTREQAARQVAENYKTLVDLWNGERD